MTDQGGFDDFEMLAGSSGGGTGGDPFGSGDGLGGDASSGVEFDASAFETPATAAVASPALSAGLGKCEWTTLSRNKISGKLAGEEIITKCWANVNNDPRIP